MQSQVEPEILPPTQAALDFKITRSHYFSKICRNANDAVPEQFGSKLKNDIYEVVLIDVANVITELSFCKCQTECQTECKTMRCKCRRNNLTCTEMCSCTDCQNDDDNKDDDEYIFDSEDDDI